MSLFLSRRIQANRETEKKENENARNDFVHGKHGLTWNIPLSFRLNSICLLETEKIQTKDTYLVCDTYFKQQQQQQRQQSQQLLKKNTTPNYIHLSQRQNRFSFRT